MLLCLVVPFHDCHAVLDYTDDTDLLSNSNLFVLPTLSEVQDEPVDNGDTKSCAFERAMV